VIWAEPMTMPELGLILSGPQPRWRGRAATRSPAQIYALFRTLGWPTRDPVTPATGSPGGEGAHTMRSLDLLTPVSSPPDGLDVKTGAPRWMEVTIAVGPTPRPGRGARTDLDPAAPRQEP
jgi:hypothetical protein